jgi:hypothetical protein
MHKKHSLYELTATFALRDEKKDLKLSQLYLDNWWYKKRGRLKKPHNIKRPDLLVSTFLNFVFFF